MNIYLLVILLITLAATLRIIPHILSPNGTGVDHWFWKKYIETYREKKQFPPVLPQYLLDQNQWYPPLFPLIISKIPPKIFSKYNNLLTLILDLVRMLFLLFVAYWLTDGNKSTVVLAGLIYATSPIQIFCNINLNPRGLAALFLDALLILVLIYYYYHSSPWLWVGIILLSGLILLTHKMTTQLFWFICILSALLYQNFYFLLLIPCSMLVALILSKGFYLKVLAAHIDIVRFWKTNWRWIGADAVRESPIYGSSNYQRPEKLHKSGLNGFLWHCFILFGFNPASWITCALVFEQHFVGSRAPVFSTILIFWLLCPCFLALLTTFVPFLRCIGAGYLYLFNTTLVASLLISMGYHQAVSSDMFSVVTYGIAIFLNICGVFIFYLNFQKNKRSRIDPAFNKILNTLQNLPKGVVWCIPTMWHEPIAYKTSHSVLWGGHGYGFKLLLNTFPRILLPINKIIEQYKVNYFLTSEKSLTAECLNDLPENTTIIQEESYLLYIFNYQGS